MSKRFAVSASLPARLDEFGIQVSAVLRTAGLPQTLFDQPRVLVKTEELFALWRAIGEVSPDPAIGLRLGERRLEQFDPIGLAALSTASFGEAMRQIARHKQLSCPEEIVSEHNAGEWSIQFRWLLALEDEPDVLTDVCFAWVLCIARHGTGKRVSPVRLELMRRPAYAKDLQRHFGCPVFFGAARNALVFNSADAFVPFVTHNAELLAMLAPQIDAEVKKH